jgi:epoxide hydrolase-like predicted phosphatase
LKKEAEMKIKAVIWDLGGVLVRTMDRSRRVQWEERLRLKRGELDRLVFEGDAGRAAALGNADSTHIWLSLRERFKLSSEQIKQLADDFWAGDRVDQDLISLIRELRHEFKIGLLSNAWPDLRNAIENVWEIADVFDDIVISAEIGLVKPDPKIYEYSLNRLDISPQEAIFIDDFAVNINAAQALGLHTIHFVSSAETQSQLKELLSSQINRAQKQ